MRAFECTGQWWLPDQEEECAAGTLHVSESGDLRLRLVGSLGSADMFDSNAYPLILGLVDKCPFGDIVTLSGCILHGSALGSATKTRENYHASRAYFGRISNERTILRSRTCPCAWRASRTGRTITPASWKIAFRPGTPRSQLLS